MSDDLLVRAEAMCEDLKDGDDDYADEREIIAELIAEVKSLRSLVTDQHGMMADMEAQVRDLIQNCNSLRARAQKAEAKIERLQAENQAAIGVGDGSGDLLAHGSHRAVKAAQAIIDRCSAVESEIKCLRAENACAIMSAFPTHSPRQINYSDGLRKMIERDERHAAYVARLEAEYVKSQAARLFYADHNIGAQWGQVGESHREPYEKSARKALEKIMGDDEE